MLLQICATSQVFVLVRHFISFIRRAHFNYDQPNKGELSFRKGDVFHVVDTLHNGVVGSWQVFRIGECTYPLISAYIINVGPLKMGNKCRK